MWVEDAHVFLLSSVFPHHQVLVTFECIKVDDVC